MLAPHHLMAKVDVLEYRNHYVHTVRNDVRENAGICLQVLKNHYVIIVEGDMREIVGCSPVHVLLVERWDIELSNALTIMMLVELFLSLLCKGHSLCRLIAG